MSKRTIILLLAIILVVVGSIFIGVNLKAAFNKEKEKLEELTYTPDGAIENFDFSLDITDIEFIPSETTKVEYQDSEYVKHTITVEGTTLKVTSVDTRNWYNRVFHFVSISFKVKVYIPAGSYNELIIDNETGDLKIPSGFTFNNVNIKQSTGDVSFNANVVNDIKIKVSTGDINFDGINAGTVSINGSTSDLRMDSSTIKSLNVDLSTGHTTLKSVNAETITITCDTGKVALTDTILTGDLTISTSTGSVKLYDSDAANIYVTTSTGDFEARLLSSKVFIVDTNTGDKNVPETTTGGKCKFTSSTGDITVEIKPNN